MHSISVTGVRRQTWAIIPFNMLGPGFGEGARRVTAGALVALLVAAAFLLGCQEMFDSDVWWHVRRGVDLGRGPCARARSIHLCFGRSPVD